MNVETAMFLIQRIGSQILRMAQFSGVPCYLNFKFAAATREEIWIPNAC